MKEWPRNDELESKTDTELLEHGIEVINRRDELNQNPDEPVEVWDGYGCDLRMEQIRDILKARIANRRRGTVQDADEELDDYDGDLSELVYPTDSSGTGQATA